MVKLATGNTGFCLSVRGAPEIRVGFRSGVERWDFSGGFSVRKGDLCVRSAGNRSERCRAELVAGVVMDHRPRISLRNERRPEHRVDQLSSARGVVSRCDPVFSEGPTWTFVLCVAPWLWQWLDMEDSLLEGCGGSGCTR